MQIVFVGGPKDGETMIVPDSKDKWYVPHCEFDLFDKTPIDLDNPPSPSNNIITYCYNIIRQDKEPHKAILLEEPKQFKKQESIDCKDLLNFLWDMTIGELMGLNRRSHRF